MVLYIDQFFGSCLRLGDKQGYAMKIPWPYSHHLLNNPSHYCPWKRDGYKNNSYIHCWQRTTLQLKSLSAWVTVPNNLSGNNWSYIYASNGPFNYRYISIPPPPSSHLEWNRKFYQQWKNVTCTPVAKYRSKRKWPRDTVECPPPFWKTFATRAQLSQGFIGKINISFIVLMNKRYTVGSPGEYLRQLHGEWEAVVFVASYGFKRAFGQTKLHYSNEFQLLVGRGIGGKNVDS